ncbi:MAG: tetratricopeptide repeat protein [bacterium]|jgi:tetratricopeptide (TPR) repeat protein
MKDRFTKNPTAHDHWKKGNELFDQQKLGASIEYFERAAKLDPNFAEAYNSMGIAFYEGKDYVRALECYKKAVMMKPDFMEALNNLGTAFLFLERYPDAAMAYEKVLEMHPDFAEAHNNLGLAYEQLHRTDDALKHYRKFIELWKGIRRYKLAAQERVDRLEQGRKSGVNEPIRVSK